MKPIKMFGLAALAALMAMAFVGASSAMAESTELCGSDPGTNASAPCPSGIEALVHVHEVSVGKGKLLSSIANIECEVLFLGDTGAAGAPQKVKGHFTYPMAGCETTSGTLCEVTETSTEAIIEVLRTAHEKAEVKGTAEVNAHCGSLINCTYNGVGLVGEALGPLLSAQKNGSVKISEQTTNKTGGVFCPKTAQLDLTTTPLEATYIGKGGAAHSCVEYEHPNKGWYTNNTCTALGTSRSNAWMLVVGPGNSHECYRQIREPKGLWIDSGCTMDETGGTLWEYEKVK